MFLLVLVVYVVVFNWTYRHQVCQSGYSYYFEDLPPAWGYQLFSWMAALIPGLWLPLNVRRPSLILFYVLYIFTYIPATFLLFQVSYPGLQASEAASLVLVLLISISLIQICYFVRLREFVRRPLPRAKSLKLLAGVTVCVLLGLVVFFRSIMSFSDFMNNFEFRQTVDDFRAGSALGPRAIAYGVMWTQGAFLPFLMMVSLFRSKYVVAAILAGAYVLTYMMQGDRAALLDPAAVLLAFLWLKRGFRNDAARLVAAVVGVLFLGLFLQVNSDIAYALYLSVVRFRLFEANVYNLALYYDFFKHNPWTLFTHITGVGLILPNPYASQAHPLPFIITGTYFNVAWDDNAGFWAQDGIGGFGLAGVPIISIICAVLFWFFDSITSKWNPCQVAVTLAVICGAFLNIPLGTVVLSGGLGILILLYWGIQDTVTQR
jgi:hypothetical protein